MIITHEEATWGIRGRVGLVQDITPRIRDDPVALGGEDVCRDVCIWDYLPFFKVQQPPRGFGVVWRYSHDYLSVTVSEDRKRFRESVSRRQKRASN